MRIDVCKGERADGLEFLADWSVDVELAGGAGRAGSSRRMRRYSERRWLWACVVDILLYGESPGSEVGDGV